MARVNDVGGQLGFGPVPSPERGEPPFHADWEARVFALNAALLRRGVYTLDELRDAIERMPPGDYLAASYYERWLTAIEMLVNQHGAVSAEPSDAAVSGLGAPDTGAQGGVGSGVAHREGVSGG